MADRQDSPRRNATERRSPSRPRRTDVVRCENCGEDYSVTYKRCPFCDERPGRGGAGRRVANNTRGGGYGGPVNSIQIVGLVISLILIIAALFIVYRFVGPLFRGGEGGSSSSAGTSQSGSSPGGSSSGGGSSSLQPGGSTPSGGGSSQPPVEPPPAVQAISLNREDITLTPGEVFSFTAAVAPQGITEPVVWTSSDTSLATVDQNGLVTNVNQGSVKASATITASCGGVSATCIVRCNPANPDPGAEGPGAGTDDPGSGGQGPVSAALAPGDVGIIVHAPNGLNIRSGPGTGYDKVASTANGDKVTIQEYTDNGWYKIEYASGRTGYVSSDFVAAAD